MILVIGSLNIDLISVTPRLPKPGETILGTSFHMAAGGKGANQAVAAARMGAPVAMVGRVGDDPFAKLVRDEMTAAGVDIERVLTEPSAFTATGSIFVDQSGQNSIVVASGANGCLTPADVVAASRLFDAAAGGRWRRCSRCRLPRDSSTARSSRAVRPSGSSRLPTRRVPPTRCCRSLGSTSRRCASCRVFP
jgi:sugar/nucleoside kinase (ribokinase family)